MEDYVDLSSLLIPYPPGPSIRAWPAGKRSAGVEAAAVEAGGPVQADGDGAVCETAWDAQIEADASAGKLDGLAAEALAEYRSGKVREF